MSDILLTNACQQLHFLLKIPEKIITKLNSNKAHGHNNNNASIFMLNVCGYSIWISLEAIFKEALLTFVFPT